MAEFFKSDPTYLKAMRRKRKKNKNEDTNKDADALKRLTKEFNSVFKSWQSKNVAPKYYVEEKYRKK